MKPLCVTIQMKAFELFVFDNFFHSFELSTIGSERLEFLFTPKIN